MENGRVLIIFCRRAFFLAARFHPNLFDYLRQGGGAARKMERALLLSA